MKQALQDEIDAIVARDTWTAEDYKELLEKLLNVTDAPAKLKAMLGELRSANPQPKGAAALKTGIVQYMLCQFDQSVETLSGATDNKDRRYFQGQCWKNLRRYDRATEEFQRAADRGWDSAEIEILLIETNAFSGETESARKALAKLEGKIGDSADYFYLLGLIHELSGENEQAGEAYDKAHEIDENHSGATFRLAYYCDLHGQEGRAIELYRKCVSKPPVHANALLNMAVLFEDMGKYEHAIDCLKRIIATNPNHARAKLFLKDCFASTTMFYDEDQAKRIARHNAVLDIPVTDFELSVRARNCLKKMNINSLGDLARITESELLAYKNFGETSLKEIKEMLTAKNLRLGQAVEEERKFSGFPLTEETNVNNEGVLATPLEQVEFSVRARKAVEGLQVATLGELAAKTEPELLSCKNFGQTSLNEVRQRLTEYGLSLRETL